MFDIYQNLEIVGKLVLAALLGGVVGFEREAHGQSAGLRTNLIVATAACLMMLMSLHIEEMFYGGLDESPLRIDPGRIASYAIASMGFLGAGAIIKGHGTVRGLTTAAGLWMNTGIGLAVGAGYFLPAIFASLISFLILYELRSFKIRVHHDVFTLLSITCSSRSSPLKRVKQILAKHAGINLLFINYHCNLINQTVTYQLRLSSKEFFPWGKIVGELSLGLPEVREIAWEESDVP